MITEMNWTEKFEEWELQKQTPTVQEGRPEETFWEWIRESGIYFILLWWKNGT